MKVIHNPMAVEGFTKMGIPVGALVPLGIVELLCVAIFLIPRTEVLGTSMISFVKRGDGVPRLHPR